MSRRRRESLAFREPAGIEEANRRRTVLAEQIMDVQTQLGIKVGEVNGMPVNSPEHLEWRRRANYALFRLQADIRKLNEYIKAHHIQMARMMVKGADVDLSTATGLIAAGCQLLRRWAETREPEPDEQAVIDAMQNHLMHGMRSCEQKG